ncbi:MAG: MFS transporter [Bradyrhizobiaceae bacterium]|nr:MFS transporter [Bradyrhizobiaceae bacterium]
MTQSDKPRVFYGWYVVYAIGLVMTTTAGFVFYNLPVLLDAFVTQHGFAVATVSNATAAFFLAAGFAGLIAGQFVDRFDSRYIIMASATMASLALLCIGLLREPWQLFAFYIVFGLAYGGCGLVPTTTIIARWFERRRAMALSISSTGLSLGGVVLTPVAAFLVVKLGLAGAAPWMALALFLGVVPATLFVVRATPAAMGLLPDGATRHEGSAAAARASASMPLAEVWRSRYFYAVAATFLFGLGAQVGGIAHVYRIANTRVDTETAAVAVACLAISSLTGRLVAGWLLSRVSSRAMTIALLIIQAVALVCLAYAWTGPAVIASVAMFGLTAGSMLMMQPLLLAEAFGVENYGRVYSVSQLVGVFGYAIGPSLVGAIYHASGGYALALLAIAAGSLLGIVTLSSSKPPNRAVA